ncbi:MAG: DUF815 domain-containing protein [Erythrobacter sp.]|jgi:predicted AAA+ superfamily ATPase|nr:DUF815 domain-containing protein [Erythrobacter sp.]
MDRRDAVFERIAAALERLAPPPPEDIDWSEAAGFVWDGRGVVALEAIDAQPLDRLRGIDAQKAAVLANLERLASGAAAHDMLLWGTRGMGKSALIRSAATSILADCPGRLAVIQIMPGALASVATLFAGLAREKRGFILYIDDLGFGERERGDMLALRSMLDGGLLARPVNVRFAVTANQRSILAREAGSESAALHERDARDDALALADRFGLTLGFHPCDREDYLAILRGYTEPHGLGFDEEEALGFAIARGNRSGRTAYQFAVELAGRAGLAL